MQYKTFHMEGIGLHFEPGVTLAVGSAAVDQPSCSDSLKSKKNNSRAGRIASTAFGTLSGGCQQIPLGHQQSTWYACLYSTHLFHTQAIKMLNLFSMKAKEGAAAGSGTDGKGSKGNWLLTNKLLLTQAYF